MKLIIIALLTIASGLFSGLILGLMSLNPFELKRKGEMGNKQAATVYPLRREGNLLLVTLVFGTTVVNAVLTVYLGSIATGLVAVIAATLLIMIFGTLLPQALFARIALLVGYYSAPFVKWVIKICWPICKPIAWVLDKWLGAELPNTYSKAELIKIVEEHSVSPDSEIEADEERIVRGALTFGEKTVRSVMTPRSRITFAKAEEPISDRLIKTLQASGHSRFPVLGSSPDEVVGMLYLHNLISPSPVGKTVQQLADKKVYFINEKDELDHVLNAFLKTKHHLFMVSNEFKEISGVVSIEDVLEEILNHEIVGEFDAYDDLRAVAQKRK